MKLITAAEMRRIDREAIDNHDISGITLMSNAAEHLAKVALEHIPAGGKVAVFCGAGNNGGDGIGAASYLIEKGISVRAFLVDTTGNIDTMLENLTPDASVMYKQLLGSGGSLELMLPSVDLIGYVESCTVIIDAILGTGLNANLKDNVLNAVEIINNSKAFTISADVPTGVQSDTGAILGNAVNADITVTFSLAKAGLYSEPGSIYSGEVIVCDIGIPKKIIDSVTTNIHVVTKDDISLPKRRRDSHKGKYGRALIIAGSVGYTGAPALTARAATKLGAGLVYLGVPETIYFVLAAKLDEEMPFPLPSDDNGLLTESAIDEIMHKAEKADVCVIGPGLGVSDDVSKLVQSIVSQSNKTLILDADGLNAFAGKTHLLKEAKCQLILTPHMGEFVRLGGDPGGDRMSSAIDFATKHECILVLKGHRTIIALPSGAGYINTTGGPAMAKGGSGDVLAGMIAALLAQKFPVLKAVTTAVYLHGLSGDMCADKIGEYCVSASDLISMLPFAVKTVTR